MVVEKIISRFAVLITAAFAFIVSLAWNDAIQAMFRGPCGQSNSGVFCKISEWGIWVYAIVITIIALVVTYFLSQYIDNKSTCCS